MLGTGNKMESKNRHSLHPHYDDLIHSFDPQISIDCLYCLRYCSGDQNKGGKIPASQGDYMLDGGDRIRTRKVTHIVCWWKGLRRKKIRVWAEAWHDLPYVHRIILDTVLKTDSWQQGQKQGDHLGSFCHNLGEGRWLLDRKGFRGGGEKWLDFGCNLKTRLSGFAY